MGTISKHSILEQLSQELPPVFARAAVSRFLPGIYEPQTLCNMESQGSGPPSTKIGKKVCYERDSFLQWLGEKIQDADEKEN